MRSVLVLVLVGCAPDVVCVAEDPQCPGGEAYTSCCDASNCWFVTACDVIHCDGARANYEGYAACDAAIAELVKLTCLPP